MRRRTCLAALGTAGASALAGCGTVRSETALSSPTVHADSESRKSLQFESGGEEIGSIGADGAVSNGRIDLSTEIWHREGTRVEAIELHVWMPPAPEGSPAEVALASPVQGDSSPPPDVTLSTDRDEPGAVIEIDDLDDLADETISTIDLVVTPRDDRATTLVIDSTIDLGSSSLLTGGYELDGQLELEFPELQE
ncbi:hypothetical protein ACFQDG_06830 [Natronoarchaeum mannanilyticum]|uniref:DUF8121 domain-containing protein n=1 Tax=Natronoarchaeum mannanilyticum TaxID=926360 RepID=A0AAV3TDG1_9EURY